MGVLCEIWELGAGSVGKVGGFPGFYQISSCLSCIELKGVLENSRVKGRAHEYGKSGVKRFIFSNFNPISKVILGQDHIIT